MHFIFQTLLFQIIWYGKRVSRRTLDPTRATFGFILSIFNSWISIDFLPYIIIFTLILQRTISKEDVGFELESIETISADAGKRDSDTEKVLIDSLKAVSINQADIGSDDDSEVSNDDRLVKTVMLLMKTV